MSRLAKQEIEGSASAPGQSLAERRVPMPHYCKEFWDFLHSAPEYSDAITVTRLVTTYRGRFDWEAWTRSIERVMARHPVLAARVVASPNGLEFILKPESQSPLRIIDLPSSSPEDRQTTARTLAYELIWEPFDTNEGRLFRAFGIRVSDLECVLGIVVHHFIVDGWSMEIIGRELLIAYAAEMSGTPFPLPKPTVEYLDHIQQMNDWLQGPEGQAQAAFWKRRLENPPSVRLPIEHAVDLDAMASSAFEIFSLEPALVRALSRRAGASRTTPFLVLLAADFAALSAIIDSNDIVVSILAEQQHANLKLRNTVGYITNLLPTRIHVSLDDSFDELIARVRQAYLDACNNQLHPYLMAEARRNTFPGFRFRRLAPESTEQTSSKVGFAPFDLPERPPIRTCARRGFAGHGLDVEHRGDVMRGRAYYLPTLYTQQTAVRFVQTFCRAIEMAADRPNEPVSALLGA